MSYFIDLEVLEEATTALLAEMYYIKKKNLSLSNDKDFIKLEDDICNFERCIPKAEHTQESINNIEENYYKYKEKVLSYA